MQPLVDVEFPADVVARQQVGFFAVLHVLARVDGAQAGFEFLLIEGFGGVGDHHVGLVVEQLFEDGHVVVQRQLRLGQEGVDEGFVGAAGGFDQAHVWLVDLVDGLVFGLVGATHQRDLAVDVEGVAEEGFFLAFEGHRNAADADVAFAGLHVRHQGFPGGLHPFDLDPEAVGQGLRHGDVDAFETAVRAFEGVGLVVAGGADAQLALLLDGVEVRGRFLCLGGGGHGQQAAEDHRAFWNCHCDRACAVGVRASVVNGFAGCHPGSGLNVPSHATSPTINSAITSSDATLRRKALAAT